MKDYKYMVCTRCMTYNQKSVIEEALRGFSMQEVSFPVVYTIVDDASTDGEPELLKQWCENNLVLDEKEVAYHKILDYGDLTFARHKEHQNLFFAILLLNFNHYSKGLFSEKLEYIKEWMSGSKYLALCEGDDYWTDSQKLKRQVDFLESHPNFSMCFHKAIVRVESGDYTHKTNDMYDNLEEREYTGIELAKKWQVPTASLLYRSYIIPPLNKKLLTGDISIVLQCATEGRIFCFADIMSVYRRTAGGVSLKKYTRLQYVDRALAYIKYFPQFKMVYEDYLIKQMGNLFYSKEILNILKIVIKRRRTIKYFLKGVCAEFHPTMKRVCNKFSRKNNN